LTLIRYAELLARPKTATDFSNREIAQIINALPKLPVSSNNYKAMFLLLLKRTSLLTSQESFDARDSAAVLDGLSKLGIDLLENKTLIKNLLQIFSVSKDILSELDRTILSQLWQFCIYAKTKTPSERIEKLTILVENELKIRDKEIITPSTFQRSVYSILFKLLKSDYKEKITEEYPVGSYSLDIAFPEQKLNIEIDGPYHYRDRKLKRTHRFRDFILEAHGNWKIIRIPHFEWEQLPEDA
jgi:hypothetical protein